MQTITQHDETRQRHHDLKERQVNSLAPPRWCRRFGELFPLGAKWILDGVRGGAHLRPHHHQLETPAPSCFGTPQQRLSAVQWLVRMNASTAAFQCGPETLFLAVQYLDRILEAPLDSCHTRSILVGASDQCTSPRRANHALAGLYLPAVVCLSLAAKYNDEFAAPGTRAVSAALSAAHT
ncbi:hypothetical protein BC828DRAFT_410051, partial [Blastocladiella britannica]